MGKDEDAIGEKIAQKAADFSSIPQIRCGKVGASSKNG